MLDCLGSFFKNITITPFPSQIDYFYKSTNLLIIIKEYHCIWSKNLSRNHYVGSIWGDFVFIVANSVSMPMESGTSTMTTIRKDKISNMTIIRTKMKDRKMSLKDPLFIKIYMSFKSKKYSHFRISRKIKQSETIWGINCINNYFVSLWSFLKLSIQTLPLHSSSLQDNLPELALIRYCSEPWSSAISAHTSVNNQEAIISKQSDLSLPKVKSKQSSPEKHQNKISFPPTASSSRK